MQIFLTVLPISFVLIWITHQCKFRGRSFGELGLLKALALAASWAFLAMSSYVNINFFFASLILLMMFGLISIVQKFGAEKNPRASVANVKRYSKKICDRTKTHAVTLRNEWIPRGEKTFRSLTISPEKVLVRFVLWGALAITVVVTLGSVVYSSSDTNPQTAALKIFSIFHFTIMSFTLFPSIIIAILIIKFLGSIGLAPTEVKVIGILKSMATWSGACGAASLSLGLLLFAMDRTIDTPAPNIYEKEYPFDALVVFPIVGVTAGFMLGSVSALVGTTKNFRNHLLGAILPVAVVILSLLILGNSGFTPIANAEYFLQHVEVGEEFTNKTKSYSDSEITFLLLNKPLEFIKLTLNLHGVHAMGVPEMGIFVVAFGAVVLIWSFGSHYTIIRNRRSSKGQ